MGRHDQIEMSADPFSPAVLDTRAAARFVGLSHSTLEKLRVTGTGPTYLKLGHIVRYLPEDLVQWLAARRTTSTSSPMHLSKGVRLPQSLGRRGTGSGS